MSELDAQPRESLIRSTATDRPRALVTGASRGIGASIAERLALRGCDLILTYAQNRAPTELLCSGIRESHDVDAIAAPFELGDASSTEQLMDVVATRATHLDIVISNAGVWSGGLLTEADATGDDWWGVVHTNLVGTQRLLAASLPHLRKSRGSAVVVSSVVGLNGFRGDTRYATAKAGLVGFARSLAKEVADDGVRINVLAPGFVDTDMTAMVGSTARNVIAARTLLNRFGDPAEIAAAAEFLALDATFCTGAVLVADGGWSL